MKMKMTAVVIGAVLSANASAELDAETEHRLSVLEWRMQQAEQKPTIDNGVLSKVEGVGISLGGDVEFDLDATSKFSGITNKATNDKYFGGGKGENWGLGGRVRLDIAADQYTDTGYLAGAHIQPLAKVNGDVGLDDAEFHVGRKDDWMIKLGRYEAYDMFPLNQDTFLEYSGNTANDVYQDGFGYAYQMKESRGRSGGGILLSKQAGNWYFETNTLIRDGSKLFADGKYHGNTIENRKNVVYVRPVLAYTEGNWTAAVAGETNLVSNAYGYTNGKGEFIDQSKRTGVGATLQYATDNLTWNLSASALDAVDERDGSIGTNVLWNDAQLGYIYSRNNVHAFNKGKGAADKTFSAPGRYDIHTVQASYRFRDVMDMENLNVYVGAYASVVKSDALKDDSTDDRFGARVRVKYFF